MSALLILGGVGHTYGVLNFYKEPETLFWSLTATLLIFLLAAINLLRTWRPADQSLAILASCGTAAYFVFTLRFGQLVGNLADPRVILFGVLTGGLTLFGLVQAMKRRILSNQM